MTYVILECGSKARGDTNIHSDSDYVCIHDDNFKLAKQVKKQFNNISFLSLETIIRLKRKGSLFLTHIDVDGNVLEGQAELLSSIKGFRPQNSNLRDSIARSRKFLSEIKWFPDSQIGQLWLMDVLFVALRNIIYCSNGQNAVYNFGFTDAIKAYGLSDEEIDVMLIIREGKYHFRQHKKVTNLDLIQAKSIIKVASKISLAELDITSGGLTNWASQWQFDYWDERLVERAILNNEISNDGFREKLQDHNYFRRELTHILREKIHKLTK